MPVLISKGDDKPRELHPAGLHQAVCVFVEDIGLQKTVYKGSEKISRKVIIVWESECKMADGRPFLASKRYTASLFDKAQLRQDLQAWRGKPFTELELESFDLEDVKYKNCFLNILHETHNGKTYANIRGIAPLKTGMEKMNPVTQELPKWIEELKAGAVSPALAAHSSPTTPPPPEDDLPF